MGWALMRALSAVAVWVVIVPGLVVLIGPRVEVLAMLAALVVAASWFYIAQMVKMRGCLAMAAGPLGAFGVTCLLIAIGFVIHRGQLA